MTYFRRRDIDFRLWFPPARGAYTQAMSRPRMTWAEQLMPVSLTTPFDPALLDRSGPRTRRDWVVDAAGFLIAVVFGVLILISGRQDNVHPLTGTPLVIDVVCGSVCCLSLWWRRRWPLGVALVCVVLGTFSASATIAGILALSSLAVHRGVRPVLLVAVLWIPQSIGYAIYSGRTDAPTVLLLALAMVLAAVAWGMFVRARRQLLYTLRERALRAEEDQTLHADRARMAERTRIAREMHDVLAHRISLMALQAGGLEVRPDLGPDKVRETAQLLRSTARQALEELRGVIGVLRDEPGHDSAPAAPQPTLADIPRLVEETRRAGAKIDFEMRVDNPQTAPSALGRDAYRIVQEALTNIGKHARGTAGRVRVTGAADSGLHICVRNRLPVHTYAGPAFPGSGAGLLGLQERVTLAGGVLVHGPDGSGDFVVDAELRW
ncbi:MAG: two-component sensor histidine kinase [Marmoricola sp.]|nr:two-component sensor histidine kinase [Marmoricola sp.]